MIDVVLKDGKGTGLRAKVLERNKTSGLVVYAEPLILRTHSEQEFINSEGNIAMNVNATFGGTPVRVHDGIDTSLWTASSIIGGKFTFNNTDQALVGTNSVKTDNAAVNDVMQFDKGSDIDLSNYQALDLSIYVDKDWKPGDEIVIYGWDTGGSVQVGTAVDLSNYFNFGDFDTWHGLVIPFLDMGLSGSTVDAFRIEIVAKEGKSAKFYIDEFIIQETSGQTDYVVKAPLGKKFLIDEVITTYADALVTTLASNSMHNLSYNKFLGVNELTNGVLVTQVKDRIIVSAVALKSLQDDLNIGSLDNVMSDGTNTYLTVRTKYREPIVLSNHTQDSLTFSIRDDLSGLLKFTAIAVGRLEDEV